MQKRKILLIGGTGVVGSALGWELFKNGHHIWFLARSGRDGRSAKERVVRALSFYGNNVNLSTLQVFEGDITLPNCGLSETNCQALNGIEEMVNCAADLGFGQTRRQSWQTNVGGTKNVMRLACKLGVERLHHFSSAYVCGKRQGVIREDDLSFINDGFHNVYERTKCEAEILLRDKSNNHFDTVIYRLGVVIGNSLTGAIPGFAGYYAFAQAFSLLRRRLVAQVKKDTEPFKQVGIKLEGNDLILPIRFPCDEKANLSMMPLDKFVEIFVRISAKDSSKGLTFNLTSKAVSCRRLFELILEVLDIRGVSFIGKRDYKKSEGIKHQVLLKLEDDIYKMAQNYLPYVFEQREFDVSNVRSVLSKYHSPEINENQVRKTLRYAMRQRKNRRTGGMG